MRTLVLMPRRGTKRRSSGTKDGAWEAKSTSGSAGASGTKRKSTRLKSRSRALVNFAETSAALQSQDASAERLAVLEDDNYDLEDDGADVGVFDPSKTFAAGGLGGAKKKRKKRKKKDLERSRRMKHDWKALFEARRGGPSLAAYWAAEAHASAAPKRFFCIVCGAISAYKCTLCASPYCSLRCIGVHKESSRCLK